MKFQSKINYTYIDCLTFYFYTNLQRVGKKLQIMKCNYLNSANSKLSNICRKYFKQFLQPFKLI